MGAAEVAMSATILNWYPALPFRGIDDSALALVGRLYDSPIKSTWRRRQAPSIDHLSIPDRGPAAICAVLDAHVERAGAIIMVARSAAPSCASVWTIALLRVQSRGTSTIAVGLDPIHLQAPRLVVHSTVAIVALRVTTTSDAGGDRVDVCIDAWCHTGQVDVELHKTTEQVVGGLGRCATVTMDCPTSVLQLRGAICYCEIPS
jgi:hypothetical protein